MTQYNNTYYTAPKGSNIVEILMQMDMRISAHVTRTPVPERGELPWQKKPSYGPESHVGSKTESHPSSRRTLGQLPTDHKRWSSLQGILIGSPFQYHWTIHENSTFTAMGCAVPWVHAYSPTLRDWGNLSRVWWNRSQTHMSVGTDSRKKTQSHNLNLVRHQPEIHISSGVLKIHLQCFATEKSRQPFRPNIITYPDRGTVSKDSATGSSVPISSKWCPKTLLPSTSSVMWLLVTRKRNIPGSEISHVPQFVKADVQVINLYNWCLS